MSVDRSTIDLLAALCDETISAGEMHELDRRICSDASARRLYLEYLDLHARLTFRGGKKANDEYGMMRDELPSQAGIVVDLQPAASMYRSSFNIQHSSFGSVLFSYLIAALLVGAALTVAWVWKLPDYAQIAGKSPAGNRPTLSPTDGVFVGQVTGMVECRWVQGSGFRAQSLGDNGAGDLHQESEIGNQRAIRLQSPVSLGDRFALSSGLMEITYSTGARVILEGPCTYEVDSPLGGYLSVGKLTARVEKRVESRESRVESTNQPSPNPESQIPNPQLSTLNSQLFAIRTPTATVTDLGTEFGVKVDQDGATTSLVFRGSVEVRATAADGSDESPRQVLHENESARVERRGGDRVTMVDSPKEPSDFVRDMPRRTIKMLDLVDVVAGGNGFSGKRNAGIDPTTGRLTSTPPTAPVIAGDGQYHRVEGLPMIDGVFIPNAIAGPVKLDSAGHVFADFANAENRSGGFVWAGGKIPVPVFVEEAGVVVSKLGSIDYASAGHCLLFLHANQGITFDLDAIRRENVGCKLLRFRATAGNTEVDTPNGVARSADIWVFVDGQVRLRRREINSCSGSIPVNIPLRANDRFLTLVATDGGNDIQGDWTLFGDPRLELLQPLPPLGSGSPSN